MPDGGELKIETSLSAVEKMVKGEQVTVIRPKGVKAAQRMDIMVRGK